MFTRCPVSARAGALEWEEEQGNAGRARAVADYVAGMTDRYAYSGIHPVVENVLKRW